MSVQTAKAANDYYVYVYIDPRNLGEFYYGKGKGSRKDAHLADTSDTEKAKRIAAIKKAGLEPIIRVVARDLTEHDALLVEKTLLWKLGRQLTNISSGYYADRFRPHDSLHQRLTGFDYRSGLYYYNVGEGRTRCWDDYVQYGFISAGQGLRYRNAMLEFKEGDIITAYLKGSGFVGVGQITQEAKPIRDVTVDGKPLLSLPLQAQGMADNVDSDELCEYVALVNWLNITDRAAPKWQSKLYTTAHVRASLDGQPDTVAFLEQAFGQDLRAAAE